MKKAYVTKNEDGSINLHNVPQSMACQFPTNPFRDATGKFRTPKKANGRTIIVMAKADDPEGIVKDDEGNVLGVALRGIMVAPDFPATLKQQGNRVNTTWSTAPNFHKTSVIDDVAETESEGVDAPV